MVLSEFLFTHQTVLLQAKARDWKHAVQLGTDLLEKRGFVTGEYYEDIIKQAEIIGPYFLVAPGMALPHTGPDKGVKQSGWALVTLSTPVNFGDEYNDPIDILITLASASKKEHTAQGIVQIVEIFDIPEMVAALRGAKTMEDVRSGFAAYYPQGLPGGMNTTEV